MHKMALLCPEENKEGKTEPGSEKKRSEARKEGKVVCSAEANTVLVVAGAVLVLQRIIPVLRHYLTGFLEHWAQLSVTDEWSVAMVQRILGDGMKIWGIGMLSVGLVAIGTSTIANVAQTGLYFEPEVMKLKFNALNPVSGFKQLFSKDSIGKLILSLMKVAVITLVIWGAVRSHLMEVTFLHRLSVAEGVQWFFNLLYTVVWRILVLFMIVAVIDWIKEKRKFESGIMMSKQEVKDERKNQDGNPLVKQKIRGKMRELSMARMMAALPEASVVITNPTHYAIAIKYDAQTMNAPIVVAMGKRLTALRIREIAAQHGVPILERKPLVRAMYPKVKIGRPVPAAYYGAIAELLAYLYRIGDSRIRNQLSRK
jgi:flagellar biosynthetic protein FlhB